MLKFIVLGLIVGLFILSIAALIAVGLCIGIAHLMIYFIPTLDLATTLVPSAILTTTFIIMFGNVFKFWYGEKTKRILSAYEDDWDEENDYEEPEPPIETKPRSGKKN